MSTIRPAVWLVAVVALSASSCGEGDGGPPVMLTGGNPDAGAAAIERYGCGACHTIPGIRGANATVGPPLHDYARRVYIAGVLPNTPEDLVRWIRHPSKVDPRTAMPDLGVTAEEAQNIAAYLYTATGERL